MREKSSKFVLSIIIIFISMLIASAILIAWNSKSKISFAKSADTKVGQYMTILGKTSRSKPVVSNEGLSRYPVYGTNLTNTTEDERQEIIDESNYLLASSSTYDSMDAEGNLYLNGSPTGQKLYKHTASVGMYYGDVDDDEPAIIKQISISPRPLGNYITGLYAPAGEVIKIEMSEEDLEATGGVKITIGQISQNNEVNNIWVERQLNRMAVIASTMTVNDTTAYVGYFLGGPIYVTPVNNVDFTVTISGAVEYMHYIYGLTTEEEFEHMKSLSTPYFDLEIWDNSVRHSGPRRYAPADYDNLTKVANLWEKISLTSKQVPTGSKSNIGIDILYDPFIAAGSAVAFVGRNWCNVPPDWMSGALNYQTFTSEGAWGVIHEYNHHFQRYGFAMGDEVTNNAITLLSYILYTNISSSRSYNDSTLSGWNRFTDPSRSLRETISASANGSSQSSLNTYADIIHSFGVDTFISATQFNANKGGVDNWYQALCEATGYDMTYYFETMLNQTVSSSMKSLYNTGDSPIFVPIASIYQTGRNYFKDNQEVFIETVKPFEIPNGKDFTLDFNQYLIVPAGFTFTIKNISQPQNGSIEKTGENIYVYHPSLSTYSGTFNVTVSLEHESIVTPDITLTINLKQKDKDMIATKYTYSTKLYSTADEALASNFEGYTTINTYETTSHFMNGLNNNSIGVIEGKIYVPENGEYVICLRAGRGNNALFISINNDKDYKKVVNLTGNNPNFTSTGAQTTTLTLKKGDYIYFKEVTVSSGSDAYMELGWGKLQNGQASVVSIPSQYLYNVDGGYKEYDFTSETIYPRNYTFSSDIYADFSEQSIVSLENFGFWDNDDTYKVENIIDGDKSTAYHSDRNNIVSQDNPYILTVDLGKTALYNRMTITGYTNASQRHMPITFDLYVGTNLDDMHLAGSYQNLSYSNRTLSVSFDEQDVRYYRLVVTDTDTHRYVAINQIDFSYSLTGLKEFTPDSLNYYSYGFGSHNFSKNYALSTFGYCISGNGYISYSFTGRQIAINTRQDEECEIEVSIDGNSKTFSLNSQSGKTLAYYSTLLKQGTHTLEIKVLKGNLKIDSIALK